MNTDKTTPWPVVLSMDEMPIHCIPQEQITINEEFTKPFDMPLLWMDLINNDK